MKKVKKVALSFVAVAACAGAFGTYESYQQSGESDALLAENVEAISQSEGLGPEWLADHYMGKKIRITGGSASFPLGVGVNFDFINCCIPDKDSACRFKTQNPDC